MTQPLDLAGLGAGPFNLSIAALIDGLNRKGEHINSRFFDQKQAFSWHPGMLLPGVRMQTSYLKDLVTGIDPTSEYTFLNYLVEHKRFYQFLTAELSAVSRVEYADYLRWAAEKLPMIEYNSSIEAVDFKDNAFELHFTDGREPVKANNLCLGTGKRPYIPESVRPYLGGNVFHAIGIAQREMSVEGLKVAIIGGGQTGAEVFENMIDQLWGKPASVHWVSRRANYEPLDETPFTNEFFTPQYVNEFYHLPESVKANIVASQKLASDGISPDTLKALYQKLYELSLQQDISHLDMRPNRELTDMNYQNGTHQITVQNGMNHQTETFDADVVILCTGFETALPSYLDGFSSRITTDENGQFELDRDFQVGWDGPQQNRIYAVNAGRHSHGIAEPQMSLMCWRSATIINSLLGKEVYSLEQAMNLVNWQEPTSQQKQAENAQEALTA